MSIKVQNAVYEHSKSKGQARLTLLTIADHQGELGAWPSIATLAKMCNSSERTVKRCIAELEELGELKVERRMAPTGGQYRANLYWVMLPTADVTNQVKEISEVTNEVSEVTNQVSDVTTVGPLTLNRTLKETNSKAKRIPSDFKPSEESWKVMAEHFPWVDLKLETHAFIDYWNSVEPSKGKKTNWDATWKNWIRNASKWSKPKTQPTETKHRFTLEDE
jgi:predicted transcriptional regulator